MLAISVELLHGTFRGDPAGTANTGRLSRGEWPPSPARLFAALVAADGTRQRCRVTDGAELAWFERLPPPVIHADGRPCHQLLEPRYVVRHKGSAEKGTHLEYVGRLGAINRAGARVAPRDPRVVYLWGIESPPERILDALRRRVARVGYLGASDSPVRMRVTTWLPTASSDTFMPDRRGDLVLDVPAPGRLHVLDRMYDEWCTRGASVSRLQFPALEQGVPYRSPGIGRTGQPRGSRGVAASRRPGLGTPPLHGDGALQGGRPQPAPAHLRRAAGDPARARAQRERLRDRALPRPSGRRLPVVAWTAPRLGPMDASRLRRRHAPASPRCGVRHHAADGARRGRIRCAPRRRSSTALRGPPGPLVPPV